MIQKPPSENADKKDVRNPPERQSQDKRQTEPRRHAEDVEDSAWWENDGDLIGNDDGDFFHPF
ncbi:MAG: hypothetical protein KW804_00680 [Candidatus Doudnabacteria bacterium]|nr:hypothetical protein [Candidatus Doudnabacteria bacterium]